MEPQLFNQLAWTGSQRIGAREGWGLRWSVGSGDGGSGVMVEVDDTREGWGLPWCVGSGDGELKDLGCGLVRLERESERWVKNRERK